MMPPALRREFITSRVDIKSRRMKFLFRCLALMFAVTVALAGCNRGSYGADDRNKVHVGIVFSGGGKDDRSFNTAAWEGVQRAAREFPIVLRDAEAGDPTAIEPAMRAFAERDYDLIVGVGFIAVPVLESVAKDYPRLNFAIVDGVVNLPNVASLIFKEHEGGFLGGR